MNVCFIGKHKYPKDIFSNEQDMKTWRSMGAYFGKLFIIAESPNLFFYSVKENNIRIYLIPRLGYPGFVFFSVILGFYLNLKYKINVFDASEIAGGGTAVAVLKFFTGKPTVIEVQGEVFRKPGNGQNLKSRLLKWIGCFAMKHAARIRVISRAIFNQVREQGIPESKIRLVSLRVDLYLFNPNLWKSDFYTFGDKMGITIGYIGRLIDGKGLEDLFEAISKLKFQILIFGNGPLEAKLKKMAEDLNIADKVEWRGFMPYSKVSEALAQIDIFVYPSWHEGFGRSIMEAMAMEKPVVATNVGGIPDLVKDGENGFLVEPHKPEELAKKIKILTEDKELREKFGKAGRKWVAKNFEWNEGIKKFAQLFLELK
ncbi:hypothetical protein A2567_01875 [Candidatus Azambacteria bacterium RIFOXYD1_FULL_42_11]|uniref:Glycosyltransferase n=4 Tax=Candidatus Azamiibacteriota TaxID=1752741 RepID=A0A0G1BJK3_9BACT|nr:MAG: Glycosyltransferase [Candidatus Azambacteria bacterium GW2011_GWB1_42_17]KKS46471.1 MAG: Glycosyltransferase [Candidatus Azambacteria bacterium GW2011_GWA1_42_19]KKS75931.1 MAG: Glycosyltransferase [Candidatus Azambacteria bacterium GW2011_GWA2_42_9]KKS88702.1 MAG: Glycosyltransferase [Parcubacteria group bacterium GW2011_GWC1_43_11]OGD43196.1 MAG: hypothetical protein A2567_01875 [Candidatus Azambacteria bacterium RIFOXYD1_FULL_42_11]